MCATVAPEAPAYQPIDMEAFYRKNRRLFYGLYLLAMSLVYLRTPNPGVAVQQSLGNAPNFLVSLLAFFVSARWAQWVAGLALPVLTVAWPIVFSSVIQ